MQRLVSTSSLRGLFATATAASVLSSSSAVSAAPWSTVARRFSATEAAPAVSVPPSAAPKINPSSRLYVPKAPKEPFRKIGNIFIVRCTDHPFKYSWEINRMLRDLRIEFKAQVVIHPDIPAVRLRLWRVRHLVSIDIIDTESLKRLLGVPSHITFTDLKKQLPSSIGDANKGVGNVYLRSRVDFMKYRRQRIKDIMHRDQQELKLLAAKKQLRKESIILSKKARGETPSKNKGGEKKVIA